MILSCIPKSPAFRRWNQWQLLLGASTIWNNGGFLFATYDRVYIKSDYIIV